MDYWGGCLVLKTECKEGYLTGSDKTVCHRQSTITIQQFSICHNHLFTNMHSLLQ